MTTQAERVAEAHERDTMEWKRYQQARRENTYDGDWGELVRELNSVLAGRDPGQFSLSRFE